MKTHLIITGPPASGKTMIEELLRTRFSEEELSITTTNEAPSLDEVRRLRNDGVIVHVIATSGLEAPPPSSAQAVWSRLAKH